MYRVIADLEDGATVTYLGLGYLWLGPSLQQKRAEIFFSHFKILFYFNILDI